MRNILLGLFGVLVVGGAIGGALYFTKPEPTPVKSGEHVSEPSAKETYTIESEGVDREFIVYRPESIPDEEEVPVVFMYHGSGQSGEQFYDISGWKEEADKEGFMVVFPTALKYHVFNDEKIVHGELETNVAVYQTKWNDFGLEDILDPAYPNQTLRDDVLFTQAMVDFVNENYATDTSRFYATGFSNGGGFTSRLSVQMTHVFAAYAPTSSAARLTAENADMMDDYSDDFAPRPTAHMIGEKDPKLTYGYGVDAFALDESIMDEDNNVRLAIINPRLIFYNLSPEYTYSKEGKLSHFTFETPADPSKPFAPYEFAVVEGMNHIYPNGTNIRLSAPNVYWDFFEQYSL